MTQPSPLSPHPAPLAPEQAARAPSWSRANGLGGVLTPTAAWDKTSKAAWAALGPQPGRAWAGANLADKAQLLQRGAHVLLAGLPDPLLHVGEARLDVLAVAEGAALTAQQQLVEQLHVDEGEELLEQRLDQHLGYMICLERHQQLTECLQDTGILPVLAQPCSESVMWEGSKPGKSAQHQF